MAFVEQGGRSRLPAIAAVALIHAGIGYAFISGLAYTVIADQFPVFVVNSIPDTPPPPDVAPPPPTAKTMPEQVTRPETVVTLQPLPQVAFRDLPTVTPPVPTIVPSRVEPIAPPPANVVARGATPKGSKGAWITSDDYPPAALRAGDEGVVAISVGIDASGRVANCAVTASSGHPALDEATCRLYARRARFAPATEGGAPVASSYTDRIRWQIPE